jgi:hypothetical protein
VTPAAAAAAQGVDDAARGNSRTAPQGKTQSGRRALRSSAQDFGVTTGARLEPNSRDRGRKRGTCPPGGGGRARSQQGTGSTEEGVGSGRRASRLAVHTRQGMTLRQARRAIRTWHSDLRNPEAGRHYEAYFGCGRAESGKNHVARGERRPWATSASARKVNVNLVAVESNEVELTAVRSDERCNDLTANLLDLLLRTLVHGGNACEKRGERGGGQGEMGKMLQGEAKFDSSANTCGILSTLAL